MSFAHSVSSFQDAEAPPDDFAISRPQNSDGQTGMRYKDHPVMSSILLSIIQLTVFNNDNCCDEGLVCYSGAHTTPA